MSLSEQLGPISWKDYEKYVRNMFEEIGAKITKFEVLEKRKHQGIDGGYEIDASIKFEMFGGIEYFTLLECKSYKKGNNVSRDQVMILNQKIQSLHAQKGIMLTTSDFQKGAVEFATKHGIALIKVIDGLMAYITKGGPRPTKRPPFMPELLGYLQEINEEGQITFSLVREDIKEKIIT